MQKLTTATAAATLGIDSKALDNILSREASHLVACGARGKSRRISAHVLELVAVALVLKRDLGIPISRGLDLAAKLGESISGEVPFGRFGTLCFKINPLRLAMQQSIADIVEQTAPPLRGRPPHTPPKTEQGTTRF